MESEKVELNLTVRTFNVQLTQGQARIDIQTIYIELLSDLITKKTMKKHEKLLKIPRFSVSRFILFDHLSNDESAEKRTLKRLNIFDRKFVYFDFILRKLSREMDETNDNI